jgi:sugar phosphate isomerase/epimerase
MIANLARLAEAARSHGLWLALELMPYTAVNTLAKAHRMVASCRQTNLGLLIDALHLARAGGTPAEVAAIPPEHISYLQLCDAPAEVPPGLTLRQESLGARLYPGEGDLPLFELLDALPQGVVVDVETPVVASQGLSTTERAGLALSATQRFLTRWKSLK